MKDTEIFTLLQDEAGIDENKVNDYRPSTAFYNNYGIPAIPEAIVVSLKGGGTLLYIPEKDKEGNIIHRRMSS